MGSLEILILDSSCGEFYHSHLSCLSYAGKFLGCLGGTFCDLV